MIHSIEARDNLVPYPVAAFGISFPFGDETKTVTVVANKVWLDQNRGSFEDSQDEEDFDE